MSVGNSPGFFGANECHRWQSQAIVLHMTTKAVSERNAPRFPIKGARYSERSGRARSVSSAQLRRSSRTHTWISRASVPLPQSLISSTAFRRLALFRSATARVSENPALFLSQTRWRWTRGPRPNMASGRRDPACVLASQGFHVVLWRWDRLAGTFDERRLVSTLAILSELVPGTKIQASTAGPRGETELDSYSCSLFGPVIKKDTLLPVLPATAFESAMWVLGILPCVFAGKEACFP